MAFPPFPGMAQPGSHTWARCGNDAPGVYDVTDKVEAQGRDLHFLGRTGRGGGGTRDGKGMLCPVLWI